jgi:hypothetical protein
MDTVLTHNAAEADMGQPPTPETGSVAETQSGSRTILRGFWLTLSRTVWVLITAVAVIMFIISIPYRYDQLANHTGDVRVGVMLHASDPEQLGISPQAYATYNLVLEVLLALLFSAIAIAIFARKSNDWMALLTSLALLTFGTAATPTTMALVEAQPVWSVPQALLNFVAWTSLGAFLFTFPDGRFVPRQMVWAFVLLVAISLAWSFFPNSPFNPEQWPLILLVATIMVLFVPPVVSQIYKYRTVLEATQRQQAKWVVFGITVSVLGGLAVIIPGLIDATLSQPGPQRAFYELAHVAAAYLFLAVLPLSIGIAILRYQLFDIDLIINRALVYIPLTAILAGLYTASIALFQRLFVAATGTTSDAAIVLTTLVLASTFTPIKNGLQGVVDKRFKEVPDPTKKLRAFNEQVESYVQMSDAQELAGRLLEEAAGAFQAQNGAVYLTRDSRLQLEHTYKEWHEGDASVSLPLEYNGQQFGLLQLGPRINGREYTPQDEEMLRTDSESVAKAIWIAERGRLYATTGERLQPTKKEVGSIDSHIRG